MSNQPHELDDGPLLVKYSNTLDAIQALEDEAAVFEAEIRSRMAARGGNVMATEGVEVEAGVNTSYDQSKLVPLLESPLVTAEELIKKGAYTEPYDEAREPLHHEGQFNITKLRTFEVRGQEVKATIDGAMTKTLGRIKVKT